MQFLTEYLQSEIVQVSTDARRRRGGEEEGFGGGEEGEEVEATNSCR